MEPESLLLHLSDMCILCDMCIFVLCLTVVPLPPGKPPLKVQLTKHNDDDDDYDYDDYDDYDDDDNDDDNNNNNNNNNHPLVLIVSLTIPDHNTPSCLSKICLNITYFSASWSS
jgi:hypothetical protein